MIKEWKPFRRQEEFLSLPYSIFEGLYGGAAGGGKSECLLLYPIVHGFYTNPRFKGIIFRRTYPELESEIIVRSQEWYPHAGAKYNSEKKRWTFPSGAIMQFGHVEYENDVRKYDTAEYNYMAFDELTSFTEFQYTYLSLTRCRSSSPNLPAIVRSGTNPGNIGHTWVKRRFIDPAPYKTIIVDKKTGIKRIFIQSLVSDNPHIEQEYAKRMELLPEAERRAKLDGDWESFEGQVFDDFRENRLIGEPDNALHVIDPFEVPDWWIRVLAIDWGYAAQTVAIWGALSPGDRLYIYKEFSVTKTKIADWAAEIANRSRGEEFAEIVMCRSAWQDRGDEITIIDQFKKFSNMNPTPSNNDRLAGKVMLHEYIRWSPKVSLEDKRGVYNHEYASEILRKYGMNRYMAYVKSYEPEEPETNLPKLQIFKECTGLITAIPRCIYNHKDKASSKPSEDVMEFAGDDFYDVARYAVLAADKHTRQQDVEQEKRVKVNEVLAQLKKDKDQTSFYRKMEHMEAENKKTDFIGVKKSRYYGRFR